MEKLAEVMGAAASALLRQACGAMTSRRASAGRAFAIGAMCLFTTMVNTAGAAPLTKSTVSVDGMERSYSYFVSSKCDKAGFNYVVFALPDNGQTAEEFAEQSGWTKVAEENGFVVVFPEGFNKTWSPASSGEDGYLKAVFDHALTHLVLPPADTAQKADGGG